MIFTEASTFAIKTLYFVLHLRCNVKHRVIFVFLILLEEETLLCNIIMVVFRIEFIYSHVSKYISVQGLFIKNITFSINVFNKKRAFRFRSYAPLFVRFTFFLQRFQGYALFKQHSCDSFVENRNAIKPRCIAPESIFYEQALYYKVNNAKTNSNRMPSVKNSSKWEC